MRPNNEDEIGCSPFDLDVQLQMQWSSTPANVLMLPDARVREPVAREQSDRRCHRQSSSIIAAK